MKDKRTARGFPRPSPIHARRPGALVWTEEVLGRCARVTVIGSRRLLVESHAGLLELNEHCIRLNTGVGPLTIAGDDLRLCDARPGSLIVTGHIRRIDLPCQGGEMDP